MKILKPLPKLDVGLMWAKIVNIWGQLGTVAGAVNVMMMVGVFYTTTIKPSLPIPLWLYLMMIVLGARLKFAHSSGMFETCPDD